MRSDRGAMLIMVAVALFVLTALSAIVIDQGVLYTARRQAQNAADAGALSGAIHLINQPADFPGSVASAKGIAHQNAVWGEQPASADVLVDVPIVCPPFTGGGSCIRVDVQRGQIDRNGGVHTNVLPTFFAQMLGIQSQAIMGTATAQLAAANATGCMRPWFMIDRYTDTNGDGQYTNPPDLYTSPGYKIPDDIGTIVDFHFNQSPSGYGQIDVGSGGNAIENAIERCVGNGSSYHIGETVPTKPGGTVGPEKHGVDSLLAWDPFATFNVSTQSVENTCALTEGGCSCGIGACPNGPFTSPRVVIVALCDPNQIDCAAGGQSNGQITITNFLSFFILGYSGTGNDFVINAQLMGAAGEIDTSGGTSPSAFLQVVRLVR